MGTVRTVCGDISSEGLGPALVHEHLVCDFSRTGGSPDNRMQNWELIAKELMRFKAAGGRAIFELTPHGMGDSPSALKRISEATGVHIIHGTAFYTEETYPPWVLHSSVDQIADFFADQIETGHDGICAGIIGEIASHNDSYPGNSYQLSEAEAKVFRAAAVAQKRTGAAISTHASLGRGGHAQLDVLEAAGADLSRVVIGHCDTYVNEDEDADFTYYLPILARGAGVQFDLIGWHEPYALCPTDELRAQRLASLIRRGYSDRLTLSTDTCRLSQLHTHGGRGFDYLWRIFLPMLRSQGVGPAEIEQMLVENPRRLATFS